MNHSKDSISMMMSLERNVSDNPFDVEEAIKSRKINFCGDTFEVSFPHNFISNKSLARARKYLFQNYELLGIRNENILILRKRSIPFVDDIRVDFYYDVYYRINTKGKFIKYYPTIKEMRCRVVKSVFLSSKKTILSESKYLTNIFITNGIENNIIIYAENIGNGELVPCDKKQYYRGFAGEFDLPAILISKKDGNCVLLTTDNVDGNIIPHHSVIIIYGLIDNLRLIYEFLAK